ncbi:MAG TPA: tetratricopeptide repeat protein, partial [Chthoniobacteraceae bacterium]|nr:tetratricopeptide repeat protein [Chthoniobacteraceae bacterium]
SQKQLADLQERLAAASRQIAEMKADGTKAMAERNRLLEENQTLRGIVLRGQKEEARRAATKKLVLGELQKIENKSKALMDQIDYLSSPIVKLSEKERGLFKKPELQISDSEISLSAPRAETAAATTTEPLPATETPAPAAPAPAPTAPAAPAPAPAAAPATTAAPPAAPEKAAPAAPATAAAPQPAPTVATASKPAAPAPQTTAAPQTAASRKTSADTASKTAKSTGPFSNLPDDVNPKAAEKPAAKAAPGSTRTTMLAKATTPAPAKLPQEDLPTRMQEKTPEKAPEKPVEKAPEKAPEPGAPAENPLAANAPGTANVSGAPMNLPAELAGDARSGKDEFDKGNYREAERIYEKVLAKAPNNLYTLSNLGVVYFRSQKLKRAEEMFKKAIAIAPEDGFSHCTLGIVFYSQQKYDEAVNELTKALAVNPKNATAHNYLGITASQKGWQEAAQKELETATALDPAYADAHFNLAVVFATQQPPNKENARKCYKRATELGAEPDTALEQMIK